MNLLKNTSIKKRLALVVILKLLRSLLADGRAHVEARADRELLLELLRLEEERMRQRA